MKREYRIIIIVCALMVILFQNGKIFRSIDREVVQSEYSLSDSIEGSFAEQQVEGKVVVKKTPDASEKSEEITRKKTISISEQDKAQHEQDQSIAVAEKEHQGNASQGQSTEAGGDVTAPAPALELPVLSKEKILPVKFKILKQDGRVNVVDIDGDIYMDMNSLTRYYGKTVDWDSEKEQFKFKLFGVEIQGSSLQYEILVNGNPVVLDQPVYRIENITYLPADAFAKEFGAEVTYENHLLEFKVRNYAKAAFKLFRS